jgi:hypothetical protein
VYGMMARRRTMVKGGESLTIPPPRQSNDLSFVRFAPNFVLTRRE